MTKQARQYLLHKLPIAIYKAACNSDYSDSVRAFRKGQISKEQLDRDLSKACTVSARLGRDEKPLHCPPWTARRNKPTRQRNWSR